MEQLITITTWILCCDKCDSEFEVTAGSLQEILSAPQQVACPHCGYKPGLGGRETHTSLKFLSLPSQLRTLPANLSLLLLLAFLLAMELVSNKSTAPCSKNLSVKG